MKKENCAFDNLKKNTRSFTIIEIITVVTIAIFLMGLAMTVTRNVRQRAAVAYARTTVAQVELALAMYEADWGVYPQSAEGQGGSQSITGFQHNGNSWVNLGTYTGSNDIVYTMVEALTRINERGGPYISFKPKDLMYQEVDRDGDGKDESVPVLIDPWKQAYVYVSRKYYDGTMWQFVGDGASIASGSSLNGDLSDESFIDMTGPFHPNYKRDDGDNNNGIEPSDALEANTYNLYSLGPNGATYEGKNYGDDSDDPTDWDYGDLYDELQDGNHMDDSWRKLGTPGVDEMNDYMYCKDDVASWW